MNPSEIYRRWLITIVVILALSLALLGIGKSLSFYESNRRVHLTELRVCSDNLRVLQVEMGFAKPIKECVEGRMKDWKPNDAWPWQSETGARAMWQELCSSPAYMDDQTVASETPKSFQELWFQCEATRENSIRPKWVAELHRHRTNLSYFGGIGAIASFILVGLTFFIRWLLFGGANRRKP